MSVDETTHTNEAAATWSRGDYHRFAKALVWELGPVLVEACSISPGQQVLDVACGTGNVAIRAAEAGASVVASDIAPQHFDAGRREARERGVDLEWVEADAQALPFRDARFDAVTSCFGAMFAPDHERVARELLRVCRPGGTIGMVNFTPDGLGGEFFATLAPYMPAPPPGAGSPLQWGSAEHVRELLGGGSDPLELSRHEYVERAPSPAAYCEFVNGTFGPAVTIREALAHEPERLARFEQDFLAFAERGDTGRPGGPAEYRYEYLLVAARRAPTA
jgi:SAM-dependent methyltransferase